MLIYFFINFFFLDFYILFLEITFIFFYLEFTCIYFHLDNVFSIRHTLPNYQRFKMLEPLSNFLGLFLHLHHKIPVITPVNWHTYSHHVQCYLFIYKTIIHYFVSKYIFASFLFEINKDLFT